MVMAAVSALVYTTLGTATFAPTAQAEESATDRIIHVYFLTGQSNSLGTVRVNPASDELRALYATTQDEAMLWNGNMNKNDGSLHEPAATREWKGVVPQAPTFNGNLCMGPEYGFAAMMERKGWNTATVEGTDHDIAIIKTSLDGGGNGYWLKGTSAYNSIVASVKTALGQLPQGTKVDISGLMYLQGESDSAAEIPLAQERYLGFLENLKTDLAQAGYDASAILTNSVVGEPANWKGGDTQTASGATSAKEFLALAGSNENVDYVYTRDMDKITGGDNLGVHYDGKSQLTIGARYAYAMAIQQGMDVSANGRVRSQEYGDAQLGETAVSLNEARAWWRNAEETSWNTAALADEVAVWDLSSANTEDTLSGNLALKGIRVEDPYRETVVIKNAGSADATLSVGSAGVELQRSNLNLQTKVATTADQTWNISGGRTLSISGALSGDHAIALQNTAGKGMGSVVLAQADTTHRWSMGNGTSLSGTSLGAVSVENGAAAALAADAVSSLTMGTDSSVAVGGADGISHMSLDTLTLQGNATFGMDFKSTSSYDSLSIGSMAGTGSAVFDFTIGRTGRGGDFTIVSGWNNAYSFSATGLGEGSSLNFVDGNLVLTLVGGSSGPDYSKAWPTGAPTQVALTSSGAFDASARGSNTYATGTAQYFFGVGHSQGSAEAPVNNFAEIHDAGATWVSAVGSTSSGSPTTMVGDSSVKVTGTATTSGTTVYNAVNATVTGDVYVELDNPNATYAAVNGAHNSDISGSNTTVIKGGTVNGNVTMGSVSGGKTIGGGTYLQIEGGTFKGMVTGGNNAANSVIRGDVHVSIEGGTFNRYVIAGGFAGKVEGDVYLNISGGDFSAMNNKEGIWAGTGSSSGSITGNTTVTIQDVAEGNSFAAYTGVLNGGNQTGSSALASRALILSGVTTGIKANLQNFTSLEVTDGSDASLTYAQVNAWLHDTTLKVNGQSSFTLDSQGNRWTPSNLALNVEEGSTFTKTGDKWVNMGTVTGEGTVEVTEGGLQLGNVSGFNGTARVADGTSMQVTTPGAGVTYELGNGANLTLATPTAASMGTLSSKGTAAISGAIAAGASGTRFAFADDWTGTVKLTKDNIAASGNQQLFLANFGREGSVIEIDGVGKERSNYVFLGTGDANTVKADIRLGGDGLTLNAGSSGQFTTFTGAWSGNGAFNFTYGATTQGFRFHGDMTGYTGNMTFAGKQVVEFGNGGIGASVGSISGTGVLNATGATATLSYNYSGDVNAANVIQGNFNLEQNGSASLTLQGANTYTGTTTINNGSIILQGEGTLGTGMVTLNAANGASLVLGGMTITSLADVNATISGQTQGGISAAGISGTAEQEAVVSHALLTISGEALLDHVKLVESRLSYVGNEEAPQTSEMLLTNSTVTNTGSNALVLNNAANTITHITAQSAAVVVTEAEASAASLTSVNAVGGDVTLSGLAAGSSLHLDTLNIAAGQSVSVYFGTPTAEEIQGAQDGLLSGIESSITVSSAFSAGAGAQLNADLIMADGSTLDLSGSVSMGSSVQLGQDMSLVLTLDPGVDAETELIALFTGVEGPVTLGALAGASYVWVSAADVFSSVTINGVTVDPNNYCVGVWGDSILFASVATAPEPATASLSLLALAALAARRRRK